MVTKHVDLLGICSNNNCQRLVSLEDLLAQKGLFYWWRCPYCQDIIEHTNFGYRAVYRPYPVIDQTIKIQWVGPDGKWTRSRPQQDFVLGSWHVTTQTTTKHTV